MRRSSRGGVFGIEVYWGGLFMGKGSGGIPPIVPNLEGAPEWVKGCVAVIFLVVMGGLIAFCYAYEPAIHPRRTGNARSGNGNI